MRESQLVAAVLSRAILDSIEVVALEHQLIFDIKHAYFCRKNGRAGLTSGEAVLAAMHHHYQAAIMS